MSTANILPMICNNLETVRDRMYKLVLVTDRNRLVPKLMTSNDLERRSGR